MKKTILKFRFLFVTLMIMFSAGISAQENSNQSVEPVNAVSEELEANPSEQVNSSQSPDSAESSAVSKSINNTNVEEETAPTLSHDLSVLGMYQGADAIVKAVMLGLIFASIVTWTISLAKVLELFCAKTKLNRELSQLKKAKTLQVASKSTDHKGVLSHLLVFEAITELKLSATNLVKEGVKERVSFRLSRLVGSFGRKMGRGTGILATIGATSPFVGLFGTVWGIMNSFIGIAKSQTTNLAVVAPGIAEALLATALGLVAAIPAVVLYNVFARLITSYKAQISDCASEVLLLLSRDLDRDVNTVIDEISAEANHNHN